MGLAEVDDVVAEALPDGTALPELSTDQKRQLARSMLILDNGDDDDDDAESQSPSTTLNDSPSHSAPSAEAAPALAAGSHASAVGAPSARLEHSVRLAISGVHVRLYTSKQHELLHVHLGGLLVEAAALSSTGSAEGGSAAEVCVGGSVGSLDVTNPSAPPDTLAHRLVQLRPLGEAGDGAMYAQGVAMDAQGGAREAARGLQGERARERLTRWCSADPLLPELPAQSRSGAEGGGGGCGGGGDGAEAEADEAAVRFAWSSAGADGGEAAAAGSLRVVVSALPQVVIAPQLVNELGAFVASASEVQEALMLQELCVPPRSNPRISAPHPSRSL